MQDGSPAPPPGLPPAGWHPDPHGQGQRYWDGTQWTAQTAPGPVPPAMVATASSRQWAMVAHLSALVGLVIGFSFVGPLVVYLIKRDEDPFVRQQAAEALNFNLSVLAYSLVGGLLTAILILFVVGLLLLPVILAAAIAWVVLVVMAAVKANRGEPYRYPLTIRFLD